VPLVLRGREGIYKGTTYPYIDFNFGAKKINVCFLTMCTFLQKILLRVVILSICIVHGGGNNEQNRGIQHYNSSYAFHFDLWINLEI